jgi:hypothetical protein
MIVNLTCDTIRPLRELAIADFGSWRPDGDAVSAGKGHCVEAPTDRLFQRRDSEWIRRGNHAREYCRVLRPGKAVSPRRSGGSAGQVGNRICAMPSISASRPRASTETIGVPEASALLRGHGCGAPQPNPLPRMHGTRTLIPGRVSWSRSSCPILQRPELPRNPSTSYLMEHDAKHNAMRVVEQRFLVWLGPRDSNPDSRLQRPMFCR